MKHTNQERKVYPMKFTKFIPLALALALTVPAYADPSDSAVSNQEITLSSFINITKMADPVETTTSSYDDTYTTLTLAKNLNVGFHVITNVPTDVVYLKATAKEAGAQVKCLGGTAPALKIVFTNDSVASGSPDGAIANALGAEATKAGNADAIAFALTSTVTNSTESGMSAAPTPSWESGVLKYTFSKAGVCDFVYNMAKTAEANTFSTHDTAGTYKAYITMSHTNTP